jgi:hypothetical protein
MGEQRSGIINTGENKGGMVFCLNDHRGIIMSSFLGKLADPVTQNPV